MARSLTYDEAELLRWIMRLFNGGRPFDLDATYSIGRMWEGLPKPRLAFDLAPQVAGVVAADATALPLPAESIESVMFDPPFLVKHENGDPTGKISRRFGRLKNSGILWTMYRAALDEFYRVLRPGGLLAFKCQDLIDSRKQIWSHFEIFRLAELTGFHLEDLFILGRQNVMWSPNMANQSHARKNHCYYMVLLKQKGRKQ